MKSLSKTIRTMPVPDKYIRSETCYIAAANAKDITNADLVCTGANDDQKIISAINALPTAKGRIVFSEGKFSFTSQVKIPSSNIFFEGQGQSTMFTQANGANLNSLFAITGTNISQIKFANCLVDGNKTNNQFADGILMQTSASSNSWVTLDNVVVQNCPNNGLAWNGNPGSSSYYLRNIHATGNGGSGFYNQYNNGAALTDSVFDSCISDTNALNGFYLATLDSHFTNCKSYFNGSVGGNNHGYYIAGYNNYFTGCQAQDNYQSGFYSQNDGDPTYGAQNNTFINCDADSNNQSNNPQYGCGFQLINVKGTKLIGCEAYVRPYPFAWKQRLGVSLEGTTDQTRIIGLTGDGNTQQLFSDTSSGTNFNLAGQTLPILATGANHSVDDIIATLQGIGLVKQS